VIGVFIASPVVNPVTLRRERKGLHALQECTIRIAAVHPELDEDTRSQGFYQPQGEGNVTNPRRRPHEARRVLQLDASAAGEQNAPIERINRGADERRLMSLVLFRRTHAANYYMPRNWRPSLGFKNTEDVFCEANEVSRCEVLCSRVNVIAASATAPRRDARYSPL
jgi:hypothetical protein